MCFQLTEGETLECVAMHLSALLLIRLQSGGGRVPPRLFSCQIIHLLLQPRGDATPPTSHPPRHINRLRSLALYPPIKLSSARAGTPCLLGPPGRLL
ncbi:hypothetical protein AAFF_G00014330 [Aldrovandia affinis]|uniref:Uncharacterized protein n=1 Tax=Aldrovandia affinis TaxID=143900 RepID=A0AAD7S6I2_9TELE|nr:hypothetical protein AAFF_G00014330 [Aldrovandia affinis]